MLLDLIIHAWIRLISCLVRYAARCLFHGWFKVSFFLFTVGVVSLLACSRICSVRYTVWLTEGKFDFGPVMITGRHQNSLHFEDFRSRLRRRRLSKSLFDSSSDSITNFLSGAFAIARGCFCIRDRRNNPWAWNSTCIELAPARALPPRRKSCFRACSALFSPGQPGLLSRS